MANPTHTEGRAGPGWAWWIVAALLLGLRVPHLTGPLDDPHAWRQCDTVFYSLSFHRGGIDLLHPMVSWLGDRGTLIFEFPLAEALSALLYGIAGPDPMWDRLVSLAFFVVSTVYLHAVALRLAGARVARLATLAYLVFPLGVFYSRAAHVDFVATAFVHGLLYHGLRAFEARSTGHALAGAAMGTLGALIKAPYIVPVLGPLAVSGLATLGLATLVRGALLLGVPAAGFLVWRSHVNQVNAAVPDWAFLPGFYKEVNPVHWYFGAWAERLELRNWIVLARRIVLEVVTPLGAAFAVLGVMPRTSGAGDAAAAPPGGPAEVRHPRARAMVFAWLAMALVYLVVFFPLNRIHNYYQIPFMAPVALLIGLGAAWAWDRLPRIGPVRMAQIVFAAFLLAAAFTPRSLGYYRVDWLRVEAGRILNDHVPVNALLVVADHNSGFSDPRLLVRAGRRGWPLAMEDVQPAMLATLHSLGARHVAVLVGHAHPDLEAPGFLEPWRTGQWTVTHDGKAYGVLNLYDIPNASARPAASTKTSGEAP